MKVAVLCKSDQTGGAAVTSRRLTEALIAYGVDATLLVLDKRSGLPFVKRLDFPIRKKATFLKERLHIYIANGFSRDNLFKIDTGEAGLPLWQHPDVKAADAVIINWVNQGMLSLDGVAKLCRDGKKVIWTMHDMWNLTGICHHSMGCTRYESQCGRCFLLGRKASAVDLSYKVWSKKRGLYANNTIEFVAVSSWLQHLAKKSSLLSTRDVHLIPNAFPIEENKEYNTDTQRDSHAVLFVAARIDDPIKGIETLKEGMAALARRHPDVASKVTLHLIGAVKDEQKLQGFAVKTRFHGRIDSPPIMKKAYEGAAAVVSTSHFENLPGTLVEGQAYGCVPVAFDRGGQRDIITHLSTGYLMDWSDDVTLRGQAVADGLLWAFARNEDTRRRMRLNVKSKFSYTKVAEEYVRLMDNYSQR